MNGWRRLALGGVLGSALAVASGAEPATPEARWSAVAACAGRSERARHACVDDVLREAGLLTTEQESRDLRQRFGRDASVPAADASTPAEPDTVTLTLASAVEGRDGKLTLTTTDGAVWRQTEDRNFARSPRAGDVLTVQKAALGSYFCQLGGRTFRCKRSR